MAAVATASASAAQTWKLNPGRHSLDSAEDMEEPLPRTVSRRFGCRCLVAWSRWWPGRGATGSTPARERWPRSAPPRWPPAAAPGPLARSSILRQRSDLACAHRDRVRVRGHRPCRHRRRGRVDGGLGGLPGRPRLRRRGAMPRDPRPARRHPLQAVHSALRARRLRVAGAAGAVDFDVVFDVSVEVELESPSSSALGRRLRLGPLVVVCARSAGRRVAWCRPVVIAGVTASAASGSMGSVLRRSLRRVSRMGPPREPVAPRCGPPSIRAA